jgi:dCMP deaminase
MLSKRAAVPDKADIDEIRDVYPDFEGLMRRSPMWPRYAVTAKAAPTTRAGRTPIVGSGDFSRNCESKQLEIAHSKEVLIRMSNGPISLANLPNTVDDWDRYFLCLAVAASIKSKDPRCQVGAVIVSKDQVVLSTGFNGFARGIDDDDTLLADVPEKLKVICHAEANSILNAARKGAALENATIFVTKFPCLACCNLIIQAGIKRIYTHDNRYWSDDPLDREHIRKPLLLQQAGVKVDAPYHPDFSLSVRLAQTASQTEPVPSRKPPMKSDLPLDRGDGLTRTGTG